MTHPWVIWHNIVIVQTLTQFPSAASGAGVWCLVTGPGHYDSISLLVTRGSQLALLWMLMSVFRDRQRQAETRNTAWLTWPDTQCMSRAYIIRLETHPIWVWSHCPPSPETVHHGDTETKAIQSQAQSLCPGCVHSDQAQIMDGTSGIRGQVIGCYGYIVAFDMIYKYKDNGQSLRWHQEKVHLHNHLARHNFVFLTNVFIRSHTNKSHHIVL